jgi:hypothetical protein
LSLPNQRKLAHSLFPTSPQGPKKTCISSPYSQSLPSLTRSAPEVSTTYKTRRLRCLNRQSIRLDRCSRSRGLSLAMLALDLSARTISPVLCRISPSPLLSPSLDELSMTPKSAAQSWGSRRHGAYRPERGAQIDRRQRTYLHLLRDRHLCCFNLMLRFCGVKWCVGREMLQS